MRNLYSSSKKMRAVDVILSLLFAAAYFGCMLPSFGSIGNLAFQIITSFLLSFLCTGAGFFLKNSMKILGVSLSLVTIFITGCAIYNQVIAQLETQFRTGGWIYQFYYDRPLIVAIVWSSAFLSITFLRICLPIRLTDDHFASDYKKFISYSTKGFFVFYGAFLIYGFVLVRLSFSGGDTAGYNFIPFNTIMTYASDSGYMYEGLIYFIGNICCLMPIGFFLKVFKPQTKRSTIIWLPILISVLIELSQILLKAGDCDIDDVILNSFGFYIGALFKEGCDKLRTAITSGEEQSIFN